MEARLTFFNTMAQVGGAAFALMFATAQYRWSEWATARLSKISMFSSLFELFAVAVLSLAVVARIDLLWQLVAVVVGFSGMYIAVVYHQAYKSAGPVRNRVDEVQYRFNFLPYLSYGGAVLAAAMNFVGMGESRPLVLLSLVAVWLFISGCFETYLTLCPNLLQPEPSDTAVGSVSGSEVDVSK